MPYRSRDPCGPSWFLRGSLRAPEEPAARERDARAPALEILAASFPASHPAISVLRPPRWPRAGLPVATMCHRHVPTVVWSGRISDGRLLPPESACGLPSPERTSAPAAGADPAPLQDASGSTPHGQDAFFIFLYQC